MKATTLAKPVFFEERRRMSRFADATWSGVGSTVDAWSHLKEAFGVAGAAPVGPESRLHLVGHLMLRRIGSANLQPFPAQAQSLCLRSHFVQQRIIAKPSNR